MDFGAKIRRLRKEKKLSLRELSKISGVSQPYLSQLETGRNQNPTHNIIQKLSKALGVSSTELMLEAGHITMEEVNMSFDSFLQAASIDNFIKKAERKKIIRDNKLVPSVINKLNEFLEERDITGVTADNFVIDLKQSRDDLNKTIREYGDVEDIVRRDWGLYRAQRFLFDTYLKGEGIEELNPTRESESVPYDLEDILKNVTTVHYKNQALTDEDRKRILIMLEQLLPQYGNKD